MISLFVLVNQAIPLFATDGHIISVQLDHQSANPSSEPVRVEGVPELDVELLRGDHGQVLLLLAAVLPELDPAHVLLVDQVGGHRVLRGVVPGA